jgi:hypothetical protein
MDRDCGRRQTLWYSSGAADSHRAAALLQRACQELAVASVSVIARRPDVA